MGGAATPLPSGDSDGSKPCSDASMERAVMSNFTPIPEETSALITVFRGHGSDNKFMATLAIDAHSFAATPIDEGVRIDINALSELPLSLNLILHFLGTLQPFFPSARHLVGIFEDSQEGRIIFLPKPRNTNCSDRERGNVDHDPIIPHEHVVANTPQSQNRFATIASAATRWTLFAVADAAVVPTRAS